MDVARSHRGKALDGDPAEGLVPVEQLVAVNEPAEGL
jgi:hypothetical protein